MSSQFARLRGALDRVGTTTPGTIVGVFAEDLTAIMNHYVEVVKEAAELKAARAQPAQAEAVPPDVVRDAERYRKLRTFHWSESSMCVVLDPKKSVLLGAVCPSDTNLDDYIDAAIAQQKVTND